MIIFGSIAVRAGREARRRERNTLRGVLSIRQGDK